MMNSTVKALLIWLFEVVVCILLAAIVGSILEGDATKTKRETEEYIYKFEECFTGDSNYKESIRGMEVWAQHLAEEGEEEESKLVRSSIKEHFNRYKKECVERKINENT